MRSMDDADDRFLGDGAGGLEGGSSPVEPAVLIRRMREGDRDAVGEFIARYGDRIRRRVRGRLSPGMRRVFDSHEILSTVARRLDELVSARQLRASEEGELWALVLRIARNAVVDKARLLERLRRAEGVDRQLAEELRAELERADAARAGGGDDRLRALVGSIEDDTDRRILEMWLREVPHVAIARALGLPAGTVRRRWAGIRATLARRLADDPG